MNFLFGRSDLDTPNYLTFDAKDLQNFPTIVSNPLGGNDLRAAINELFSSPQFIVPLQRRGRQKLLG